MNAEKLVQLSEKDLLCVVGGSGKGRNAPSLCVTPTGMTGTSNSSGSEPSGSDDVTFLGGLKYGFLEDGILGTLDYMRTYGVERWAIGCFIADVIMLLPVLGAGYLLAKFNQPSKRPKKKK